MNVLQSTETIATPSPHLRSEAEIVASVRARVALVYGRETGGPLADALIALALTRRAEMPPARAEGWSERDAMLITYGDTIREAGQMPLRALGAFLRKHLGSSVSLVHLLPHFPFSSDDGFSVIDYRKVREDLGDWDDVEALAADYRLVFDAVVNHVSQHSDYVKGHCSGDPARADFAVAIPEGTDTSSVLRTRNLPLLHPFETVRGVEWLWTTFSADQVDLNFRNPAVLVEVTDVLLFYAVRGASMLRLDAIPYLWKELGTSCAHLPQTHEIIKLWRDLLDLAAPHLLLLTETNVPHKENVSYFGERGDEAQIIYNFSLPPLLLWALHSGDASVLTRWAATLDYIGPRATYLNITATHDGIGMRPTEGILTEVQRQELCDLARRHGGDITGKRNADGSVSFYELNVTYFDALNDPAAARPLDEQIDRFVLSQAVPMALMGVPAFYLPAMLGTRNDQALVVSTGRARSINRSSFDVAALERELADPGGLRARVLARIKRLLDLRATLPAFHPDAAQEIPDLGPSVFAVLRRDAATGQTVLACHNVASATAAVRLPEGAWRDAIADSRPALGDVSLPPFAVCWFVRSP